MLTDITLHGLVYSLCLLVHCASAHCPLNDQKPPTPMAPTAAQQQQHALQQEHHQLQQQQQQP